MTGAACHGEEGLLGRSWKRLSGPQIALSTPKSSVFRNEIQTGSKTTSAFLGAKALVWFVSLVFFVLIMSNHANADTLIFFDGTGGSSNPPGLYNFDTVTSTVTLRVPVSGTELIWAMDARPSDSKVFGVNNNSGNLFAVNIDTGVLTFIGNTGISQPTGLAFDPVTDDLFVLSNSGQLYSTDPETAASTFIGIAQFSSSISCPGFTRVVRGISFSSDGTLFGFDVRTGLFELDTLTATPTFIGRTSCSFVSEDSAFTKGGELFLADFNGNIFRINTFTGARTFIASTGLGFFLLGFVAEPERIQVSIDIKPGSFFPNSIDPRSKGVIPVAILTSEDFDATTVDPGTVSFGPDGARESHGVGHIEDVDSDGDGDVVYHFPTEDSGIQCGDTTATLTGATFGGQPVMGSDSIVTRGCK